MYGVFVGVVVFANDVALIAPNRTAMPHKLKTCEAFAVWNYVVFSKDPNLALSNTKCLYMSGKKTKSIQHRSY